MAHFQIPNRDGRAGIVGTVVWALLPSNCIRCGECLLKCTRHPEVHEQLRKVAQLVREPE